MREVIDGSVRRTSEKGLAQALVKNPNVCFVDYGDHILLYELTPLEGDQGSVFRYPETGVSAQVFPVVKQGVTDPVVQ